MPRTVPSDRLERLLAAAAATFVDHGFERAQMDDVAERLGVAKGTVYRSVASKEALLVAVVDFADHPASAPVGTVLDDRDLAGSAQRLRGRLAEGIGSSPLIASLRRAAAHDDPPALGDEVAEITRDLFDILTAHRIGVMVLDRCAAEVPEVAAAWYGPGRYALVDAWATYLARHAALVTHDVPVDVLARSITELVTTWAVKMPWDPAPRDLPDDLSPACAAMIRNLVIGGQR